MFESRGIRELLHQQWTSVRAMADAGRTGSPPVVDTAAWVQLVGDCQELMNTLGAIQSVALGQVSAIDDHLDPESGQLTEVFRGVGHERLDAPALVAESLGVTASGATHRVAVAVDLVARHGAVVAAMGEGRLDVYRAGIVATELAEAGATTCAAVMERIREQLGAEPGGLLRRRIRRTLGAVDADLVREQAARARGERSLRRSAHSAGVDEWSAKIPVEDSRPAWSVLDTIARQYVRDGRCATLEQAREVALIDAIMGRATGQIAVHLTVPVSAFTRDAGPEEGCSEAVVPVTGFGMPGVTHVRAEWLKALVGASTSHGSARTSVVACQDETGALASLPIPTDQPALTAAQLRRNSQTAMRRAALLAPTSGSGGGQVGPAAMRVDDAYRPPSWLIDFVRARDGRCRFPGCLVSARFCDVDHVVPWPVGATHAANLICLCRRHHRIKQRPRWRTHLLADGRVAWTDPTGRSRTTLPIDHLNTHLGAGSQRARCSLTPAIADVAPAPTGLEEWFDYLVDTRLVEVACRPSQLTGRNRKALARGNRVSTRHLERGHLGSQVVVELDPARLRRREPAPDDAPPF